MQYFMAAATPLALAAAPHRGVGAACTACLPLACCSPALGLAARIEQAAHSEETLLKQGGGEAAPSLATYQADSWSCKYLHAAALTLAHAHAGLCTHFASNAPRAHPSRGLHHFKRNCTMLDKSHALLSEGWCSFPAQHPSLRCGCRCGFRVNAHKQLLRTP